MKIITAMVQPFMLNKITYAFEDMANFPGMTVTEARGFGRKQSPGDQRAAQYDPFHPKSRIEIVAPDEMVESIVNALVEHAYTGKDGDGKVFVWDVERAVRVQTGETDESAV
jgi:nitrogen regulatory protein PII